MGGVARKWGAVADDAGQTPSIAPAPEPEQPEQIDERDQRQPFFIVGVGASAGGLEALTAFLKALALDSMAVVIVQHLAPKHESLLPTLLSRWSEAKVTVRRGRDAGRAGAHLRHSSQRGSRHLAGRPAPHGAAHRRDARPAPPHRLFLPLARRGPGSSRSIGIVLSGTGSDGTFGLQAIKEAGGITFAQEPTSAKYDGMPRSAIDSGWADFTLPPEDIATELLRIRNHPYLTRKRASSPQAQESVGKLIVLMRAAFGNDLTYYKPTTMDRRIERRMALQKIESLSDYVKFVQSNPAELRLLYKDMLISVTSFFRDPESFETLKTVIFPRILESKETGRADPGLGPRLLDRRRGLLASPSRSSSCWASGPRSFASRSSAPTSTSRRFSTRAAVSTRTTSRSTSRRRGSSVSSSRRRTGIRSPAASATWWCSPFRTSPATRPSRASTW